MIREAIRAEFMSVQEELEEHRKKILALEKLISECNSQIIQVQSQLSTFELRTSGPSSPTTPGPPPLSAYEVERRRSIVLANVPEFMGPSNRDAWQWDFSCVSKVLAHMNIGTPPTTIYRLGKVSRFRPRLIKVVLPCTDIQKQVLSRTNLLRSFPTGSFPPVFLRPSLTKEQRDLRRSELLDRSPRIPSHPHHSSRIKSPSIPPLIPSSPLQNIEPMDVGNDHRDRVLPPPLSK
ncbi:unnamed protein product [Caenorhabditis sp. 36 PRJEB53466]|nr:unnamed protein product [Caenorhabditis sp. 36 PRJEB53466]